MNEDDKQTPDKPPEDLTPDKPPEDLTPDESDSQDGPSGPLIYAKMASVMQKIGPIAKTEKAAAAMGGYPYRGIDKIASAVYPLLCDYGVTIGSKVLESSREKTTSSGGKTMFYTIAHVRYTFSAVDGSSVSAEAIGEGMDPGDKASNKAMSAAFKYALLQVLCIPVAMVDSDATPPAHENPDKNPDAATAQPRGQREKPISKPAITSLFNTWQERYPSFKPEDFVTWVHVTTEREFACRQPANWTRADFAKCCDALGTPDD